MWSPRFGTATAQNVFLLPAHYQRRFLKGLLEMAVSEKVKPAMVLATQKSECASKPL